MRTAGTLRPGEACIYYTTRNVGTTTLFVRVLRAGKAFYSIAVVDVHNDVIDGMADACDTAGIADAIARGYAALLAREDTIEGRAAGVRFLFDNRFVPAKGR